MDDKRKCATCENEIDDWTAFPGGICLECYERKMSGWQPTDAREVTELFAKSVNA